MPPLPDPAHESWDTQATPSRPEPAAYLHSEADRYHSPASLPLYPSGPTTPPPPPVFPMLYPSTPEKRRISPFAASWLGVIVGMLTALLLVVLLGLAVIRGGIIHLGQSAGTTGAATTGTTPGISHTPSSGHTPVPPGATASPASSTNATPRPQTTATPPGQATATAVVTGTVTATATVAPLAVSLGCWAAQDHQSAQFCVQTAANATLALSVVDCDGVTDPNAPTAATTDGSGNYLASWSPRKPGQGCRTLTVTVQATAGARQGSATAQFNLGG